MTSHATQSIDKYTWTHTAGYDKVNTWPQRSTAVLLACWVKTNIHINTHAKFPMLGYMSSIDFWVSRGIYLLYNRRLNGLIKCYSTLNIQPQHSRNLLTLKIVWGAQSLLTHSPWADISHIFFSSQPCFAFSLLSVRGSVQHDTVSSLHLKYHLLPKAGEMFFSYFHYTGPVTKVQSCTYCFWISHQCLRAWLASRGLLSIKQQLECALILSFWRILFCSHYSVNECCTGLGS